MECPVVLEACDIAGDFLHLGDTPALQLDTRLINFSSSSLVLSMPACFLCVD